MNSADDIDIDFQVESVSIPEESGTGQMNRSEEVSKTGLMEDTMEEKMEETMDPRERMEEPTESIEETMRTLDEMINLTETREEMMEPIEEMEETMEMVEETMETIEERMEPMEAMEETMESMGTVEMMEEMMETMEEKTHEKTRTMENSRSTGAEESGRDLLSMSRPEGTAEAIPRGMINHGATCYANAVLQALHAFPDYHRSIRPIRGGLLGELVQVMNSLSYKPGTTNPQHFLLQLDKEVRKTNPTFRWNRQQDAREVLAVLMEAIGTHSPHAQQMTETMVKDTKTCLECGNSSVTIKEFPQILTPVKRSLTQMVKLFSEEEVLDGDNKVECTACSALRKTSKRTEIVVAPQLLVLVVNREVTRRNGRNGRDNRRIEGITELTIETPHIGSTQGHPDLITQYETLATIHHSGMRSSGDQESGHYTAYVRNKGVWWKCNDTEVTKSNARSAGGGSAYLVLCKQTAPQAEFNNSTEEHTTGRGDHNNNTNTDGEATGVPREHHRRRDEGGGKE